MLTQPVPLQTHAIFIVDAAAVGSIRAARSPGAQDVTPSVWVVDGTFEDPDDFEEGYEGVYKVPLNYLFTSYYRDVFDFLSSESRALNQGEVHTL